MQNGGPLGGDGDGGQEQGFQLAGVGAGTAGDAIRQGTFGGGAGPSAGADVMPLS